MKAQHSNETLDIGLLGPEKFGKQHATAKKKKKSEKLQVRQTASLPSSTLPMTDHISK